MEVSELSHYGPSLCVKFHGDYVLAGYGMCIHVYELLNGNLVNTSRIFHRNKVHGFVVKNGLVLIYGARSVSIVPLEALFNCSNNSKLERMCHEWIISAEFSFDCSAVYLLTSYNKVLYCDLSLAIIDTKAVFGERAILYSGTITVLGHEKVRVNAGTVMDGVFIWDMFTEQNLHHFTDHEGSIFFVVASQSGRYVASCSDDRSIKLWDLESGQLISTGWGHTARIWNLQFFDNDTKLISVSEDCTCRTWDVSLPAQHLPQIDTYEVHMGKNVWGVDVNSHRMIAATSGNDGRIKLTDLHLHSRPSCDRQIISLKDITLHGIKFKSNEMVKGFHWFRFGLIVMTSEGQVLKYDKTTDVWSTVLTNEKFGSNCITAGIQELNLIVFSNTGGDLLIAKFSNNGTLLKTKEVHINAISKTTNCLVDHSNGLVMVLLQSPNEKEPLLCLKMNGNSLSEEQTFQFKRPTNFSATCILYHQQYLLLGSRYSSLAVFDTLDYEKPAQMIRRMLPGDSITSLKYVEGSTDGSSLLSVTDRDGYYCFISMNLSNGGMEVVLQNKIAKGSLEGAHYDERGDYIIHGFRSNTFVVYNETKNCEILSEHCSGSHRLWKLLPNYRSDHFILIYIKDSCIHIRKIGRPVMPQSLRDGLHGREIRDVTILPNLYGVDKHVFCSGSEDTTVRLNWLNIKDGKARTVWTFRAHTSGLQRCKFVNHEFMITCAAREELYLWKLTKRFDSNPYMSVISILPPSTEIPDLRIMDFDVKFMNDTSDFLMATVYSDSTIKLWVYEHQKKNFRLITWGKYEKCCLLNVAFVSLKDRLILMVSPTDGHLVLWDLSQYLPVNVQMNELVCTASDVQAIFALPKYVQRINVHKAGIKSIEIKVLSDLSFLVYSGGDDNAIAISKFAVDDKDSQIEGRVISLENHGGASTITSVNLLNNKEGLITASVDQRLRYYDISDDQLRLENVFYTTNADTGCLDILTTSEGSLLLIGGVGLSCWALKLK
ncbi:LANO_0F01112g1_1 [Lachancea nothofagi CBS 11611]|uniref:LANO_0F01112g1_1 n=1 Tax=Lachancea nothofagi CBS 11611 TaxID=1266666 RepID=A0A1G4K5W2_9SACH|nr:LANO_0F01112g1_1 [Lachancea nothofagi CBS 11611]